MLYVKTKDGRCGQFGFFSLSKDFKGPKSVQLNCSHWEFPRGLYGVVVDCLIPYILHKFDMISLSKDLPRSE